MADQLFKRRKARTAHSLRRRQARRSSYDMVLIVCEGEKTEPNYFKGLIDDFRLNTANVVVAKKTGGSSPKTIVDFALKEYEKEEEYDRIYCVFDKDRHSTYLSALDRIKRANLKEGHSIIAITSVPCFEFWLLLHYVYTTKQFDTHHGSICANVILDLRKHIPDYNKCNINIYQITRDRMDNAIEHSKKVLSHCKTGGTDMPSTKVHELVKYLKKLKP